MNSRATYKLLEGGGFLFSCTSSLIRIITQTIYLPYNVSFY